MRTQDRGAAAGRKHIPVGPVPSDRLPTPPRERKPALAALAALLILVGALGATMLVLQAGDRVEAIKITERVPAGQPIPDSAMTSVLVAEDSAVNYVEWGQRSQVQENYRAGADLVAGSVLVGEMLTDQETLPRDEVVVGVSLQPGQFPAGLKAGDTVTAYWVGDERAPGAGEEGSTTPDEVITEEARVASLEGGSEARGNDALPVTLRVDRDDAASLSRAASQGDVALVIVASSEGGDGGSANDGDGDAGG